MIDMKQILRREEPRLVTIDPEHPEDAVRAELHERAKNVLNYKPMWEHPRRRAQLRDMHWAMLYQALKAANVKPFTRRSVGWYMFLQRLRVNLSMMMDTEEIPVRLFCVAMFAGAAAVIGALPVSIIGNFDPLITGLEWAGGGAAVTWLIFFGLLGDWGWKRYGINRYNGYVSDQALRTALAVKAACPAADIDVDALEYTGQRWDPFLVVTVGSATAYVEVWDEPRYRERRVS